MCNLIINIWSAFWNLEPAEKISMSALLVTLFSIVITSLINRKNSFENLFFHLISLLNDITKNSEYKFASINATLKSIKDKSNIILNIKIDEKREEKQKKVYTENNTYFEESLVYLENLELILETKKASDFAGSTTVPIRKKMYLTKIHSIADLNALVLKTDKYTLSGKTYQYDNPTNRIENFCGSFNFALTPANALFKLINDYTVNNGFQDLIEDLSTAFPNEQVELKEIQKKFNNLLKDSDENYPVDISVTEKRTVVESVLKFNQYGVFFRTVHRIIKITLSFSSFLGIINRKKLSKYCGILRTQLSEEQLLLLYYNAQFTERGKKFKALVQQVNLWGDIDELTRIDSQDLTHFKYNSLIWPESDLDILRKEYIK